ncbi:MAG: hypothetical protein COZ06_02375 [Armatimonadetes bacterium CG_4_10_14_3_um_filter_66_18]|nr:hypothetical protein [Armatimonadota bacterium]OIP10405.1 MAG: hypothetical protein AUJ96_03950 [Armatimonadetes bacterium CG2_30_66_41]PIU90344.1 MAG: hypothetical protein COS65_25490 [Armatimonadetes bacterium CG06_land_8_20_14_3_00_66_21]PIX46649.1 MAG: hypothetical protein COZ57_10950 [Armatimonadetes bacterium CG_4_8_14_3_um_filter_66_20]PIY52947.1 MAG: hypothetical protein COZ06_02375 [Armatimonadetes bacterium CG_4_10_14_3_um_filter_66_18]PIZ42752.1 MAG: hypothetical protein COY42_16
MNGQVLSAETMGVALRWLARGLSVASVGLVLLFLVGEGPPPLRALPQLLLFPLGVCLGMVLAWKWEVLGGAVTTAAVAGFYLQNYVATGGLPKGPWFLLIAAPGLVFLAAGILKACSAARLLAA